MAETRTIVLPWGKALALRREREGLTQLDLAELVGIQQSTVSKWEGRATSLRDRFLLDALVKHLNATYRDLVEGRVPANWVALDFDGGQGPTEGGENWREDAVRAFAPNTPPALARELLSQFDSLNQADRDAALAMIQGLYNAHHAGEPGNNLARTRRAYEIEEDERTAER